MMLGFVCASLIGTILAADFPLPSLSLDALQSYQEAKAKAGRSPDDQVKLALWCEAHGLTSQRLHHLSLAILADPKNAAARGLMGLVARDGRWLRPEAIAEQAKADPVLAEYQARRLRAAYTADAQWNLGLWADEHGLKEQAKAHLTVVIRLDPKRETAWKKLGYKRHEGRWVTDVQLADEKAEVETQKAADKVWRPRIDHLKSMLDRPASREEAEAALSEITDPRAVPSIVSVFIKDRASDQLRAVQLLGQIDSPHASRVLAGLAVFARSDEVRRGALETLRRRDPRDFVGLWVALVRKPIKYEVKPVGGPGSPGTLLVEGEKANFRRSYAPPPLPEVPPLPGATLDYDANGLTVIRQHIGPVEGSGRISEDAFRRMTGSDPASNAREADALSQALVRSGDPAELKRLAETLDRGESRLLNLTGMTIDLAARTGNYRPIYSREFDIPIGEMIRETQTAAVVAQQQLAADVAWLDQANLKTRQANEPILLALKAITGGDFGDDPAAWNRWWATREGYALMTSESASKPTYYEDVPLAYTPQAAPGVVLGPIIGFTRSHSCFAAGTAVRTIDGDRPIETIRRGDLVLVQDPKSGALEYQGVIAAYHNPPSPTLKIRLGGSQFVVATPIHRFWKAGAGWTMARDLQVGDPIRTLDGIANVEAVEEDKVQPVFNLEVGGGHSFLVGKLGALVHDNSLVEPTPTPFDALSTKTAK